MRPGLRQVLLGGGARFDYYVDPVAGSALNSGRSPAAAKAAFSDVPIAAGMRVGLARQQTVGAAALREAPTISSAGVLVGAYGAGFRPKVWGSTLHTSGWSNISGNIYQKTIGYTALNAFKVDVDGTVTKLILGTFGSLTSNQFGVSGSNLQINIGADPSGVMIEVPKSAVASGCTLSAGGVVLRDIDFWFASDNGVGVNAVDVALIERVDIRYNANDGGNVQGGTNIVFRQCTVKRNGQTRTLSGGAGDGISAHTTSTIRVEYCDIQDNEKSGIGNQCRVNATSIGNYLRNNNEEITILNEGSANGGTHRFYYNVVVVPGSANAASAAMGIMQGDVVNPPTVEIYNNVLYGESIVANRSGLRLADGTVSFKNNIVSGFARGIDWRSTDAASSSLANDYNCMNGNSSNYFNNGTPGVAAGAHDITGDPLFTSAAGLDFTLQGTSPCRNAGVAVGLTSDKNGVPVPLASVPCIGAYERL